MRNKQNKSGINQERRKFLTNSGKLIALGMASKFVMLTPPARGSSVQPLYICDPIGGEAVESYDCTHPIRYRCNTYEHHSCPDGVEFNCVQTFSCASPQINHDCTGETIYTTNPPPSD